MFVPLTHEGEKGWIFNLVCPGNAMSVFHERLMLLKRGNRNFGFDIICKEKHVYIAYNNEWGIFKVSNITGEMVKFPLSPYVHHYTVAWDWEIQEAFFEYNDITPHWTNCNYTWGVLNDTTGQWSGAVGLIQRDEADYAIIAFTGTHPRSKVAAFSPGIMYTPDYWYTRYPRELPPIWNLSGLFTRVLQFTIDLKTKLSNGFSFLVCVDVDILLNVSCHSVIETIFKNLQNFVSRDNIIFNRTGPFPFQVIYIYKKDEVF